MHFQVDPHYEVKVVRCVHGAVYDVIIDLRPHSSTYLQWEGFELSEDNLNQLYVPRGFAHGYQTLTDNTIVNYLCSAFYKPEANDGIRHDDLFFGIKWPLDVVEISQKDRDWPNFVRRHPRLGGKGRRAVGTPLADQLGASVTTPEWCAHSETGSRTGVDDQFRAPVLGKAQGNAGAGIRRCWRARPRGFSGPERGAP